jgi:hypothetical protein
MAKFSSKSMGKENGPASVYAKPHTMSGKPVTVEPEGAGVRTSNEGYPIAAKINMKMPPMVVSIGANTEKNMNGEIEMRGAGAATKGRMSRGPMA